MKALSIIHRWKVNSAKRNLAAVSARVEFWKITLNGAVEISSYFHNKLADLLAKQAELQERLNQLLK